MKALYVVFSAGLLFVSLIAQAQGPAAPVAPKTQPSQAQPAAVAPTASAAAPTAAPTAAPPKGAVAPAAAAAKPAAPEGRTASQQTKAQPSRPPPAPPKASPQASETAAFLVRLRELQARVDELKEQIRRSHARLSLIGDTVLAGGVGTARAQIRFQNEMSAAFRVTRVLVLLDGVVQYNKADESGALSTQREIPIFGGTIAPGDHTLQVSIKLRGHGYGIFSYLRGFTFEVKDQLTFSVAEGNAIEIAATAWEKGGTTTALEERPALRFTSKLSTGSAGAGANKPATSKAPAGNSTAVGAGAR